MKKLTLRPRDWPAALGAKLDNLFAGGTPFTAIPPPFGFLGGAGVTAQEIAMREELARQQAGAMGGYGGQLLSQLMSYKPYAAKPPALQEGKVNVQLKLTRIDKEHVLVEVECIQRIVHNKKELRELTAKLIEDHAEQYLFQAPIRKDVAAPQHDLAAKEPIPEKIGHE